MIEPITIEDLTTVALDGTGVFDTLMQTVQLRIQAEYARDRIQGSDYSKVYLGALEATLGQSIQFLLNKDKAANEAALIAAQVLVAEAQIEKVKKEGELIDQQIIKMQSEIKLTDQQIELSKAQQKNLELEAPKILAETALIDQQTRNAATTNTNLLKQQQKTDNESALLAQKKASEEAQIRDVVNGAPVAGAMGKQQALYKAQTDGFARDAEQRLSKIMADSWSIRRSTDETLPTPTGLDDDKITAVLSIAQAGIATNNV
jgi:hypothetical protein